MNAVKNALRVRVLNNLQLEIPIIKGFQDFWIEELIPVKWKEVDSSAPVCFGADGLFKDGVLYRFKLAQEMPKIFEQNLKQKQHPVLKALSLVDSPIVDLTLGEGRDALTFLNAGREVIAFERNPSIAVFFLLNIFHLSQQVELPLQRLQLNLGSFPELLCSNEMVLESYQQFYYDPMYRPEKRKALPRGTIQMFEELVQAEDQDQVQFLQNLLERVQGKVVVKRAKSAAPILPKMNYQLETKLVRYDVYLGRDLR